MRNCDEIVELISASLDGQLTTDELHNNYPEAAWDFYNPNGNHWMAEAIKGNPRLLSPTPANPKRAAFFASFRTRDFHKVEADYLALPSLPYRIAAKVLTPGMKAMIRKVLK